MSTTTKLQPVKDLAEVQIGQRVQVSFDSVYGVQDDDWYGPGVPGTVAGRAEYGELIILLDQPNIRGSWALMDSRSAQKNADRAIIASVSPSARRFCWIAGPSAIQLPDLSPQFIKGPVTCKCGFMNCDVSVNSIVNGQYLCYNCRVITPRERAA